MGAGHSHGPRRPASPTGSTCPGTRCCTGCPAEVKLVGLRRVRASPSWPRRASQAWAFAVYALLLVGLLVADPGARPHGAAPHGHRGAVPRLRGRCCPSSPSGSGWTCSGCRCRSTGCSAGSTSWPRGPSGVRRGDPAVGHHHAARPHRRAAAAARAGAVRDDPVVHGPLPRRRRGRHAADVAGPGRPRASRPGTSATSPSWPRRPARCSSAPTSAASGSTWPWCSRGFTGTMPQLGAPPSPPRRSGLALAGRLGRRGRGRRGRPRGRRRGPPGSWWQGEHRDARAGRAGRGRPADDAGPAALELRGVAFAYPDGHQALFGVDLRGRAGASGWPCSGPTAPARPPCCCTSTASSARPPGPTRSGQVLVGGVAVSKATLGEVRRRVGLVFQDPDDQLFMPTVRDDVAFGPTNLGLRGAELDARVDEALDAVGMRAARRPPAAPPVLRAAPPGRGRHRAGHALRGPRPRRAVEQPGPGQPPGAARRAVGPARHRRRRHPRPAVRAGAVRAQRRPGLRARRPRRRDAATSCRTRSCWPGTAWSCPWASTRRPCVPRGRTGAATSLP